MILQRLTELYDRLANDPEQRDRLPRRGSSIQKISFEVILDKEGNLVDILDAKMTKTLPPVKKGGKEKITQIPRDLVVCGTQHPSGSAATPRFLWDTSAYMLGYYTEKSKKKDKDKQKAIEELFPAYRDYHLQFQKDYDIQDEGFTAVCYFLSRWNPLEISEDVKAKLEKFADNFGVFKILGDNNYVYEHAEILLAWDRSLEKGEDVISGMALDSGEENVELARLIEPKIKLPNSSVGGASLASFNCSAFASYGKSQSFNSPISQSGAFKVCNALNFLLDWPRHHLKIAETTVVFWTGQKTEMEDLLGWVLGAGDGEAENEAETMDVALQQKLKIFWQTVANATNISDVNRPDKEQDTPFFMLGLEANAARVVIRFWHESTVGDLLEKLKVHHQALQIEKKFQGEKDHLALWQIIRETVRDSKDIPPLLSGALLRSIIDGLNYPVSLYQMVLNRVNVSHADNDGKYQLGSKVTYPQASIIKAFLVRNHKHGEINMSLNTENKSPAYLLGRLFATLEKTQNEASGGVNAGIGDKFYSSASATPKIVFPTLLDLFRKHLKKLENEKHGYAVYFEKLVTDILDSIDSVEGFPANLSLEDRGLFALGYYQQMRVFFAPKEKSPDASVESSVNQ